MNKYFFICLFLLLSFQAISSAQNVPNGGFENWGTRTLFEEPDSWTTGNILSFLFNQDVALKTTDSYNGEYALRLQTQMTDEILPAYAFSNGLITEGDQDSGFQFAGGFPLSGTPTQLSGYFKYNIPFLDAGLILVSFKKEGVTIGQEIYPLLFSASDYTRIDIPVTEMSEVPDTAFIGFATTNPENPRLGGWIQVDSLWFSGIEDPVPNGNFENWDFKTYYDPADWLTANLYSYLFGGDTSAIRTTDSYSGDYAIRIESIETVVPDDEGMVSTNLGYLMPYTDSLNLNETLPAFPVDFNPSVLSGYYKFSPYENDTASIIVVLTDNRGNEYEMKKALPAAAEYSLFELTFDYPYGVTIVSVSIVASTSLYFDPNSTSQDQGELGSVLFLDDLELTDGCQYLENFAIEIIHSPDCEDNSATLDAGEGWASYYWSNGDTTQTTTISVNESMTISAIVTSSDSYCFYSDEINLNLPDNCITPVESKIEGKSFRIFPNPGTGLFHLEIMSHENFNSTIEVITLSGRRVFSEIFPIDSQRQFYEINLSHLDPGFYYVRYVDSNLTHYCPLQIR